LDRPPALQAAPGTPQDSLGAFLVDSPQNLSATLKTRPESFHLWRVAGGQDSHLLCGRRPRDFKRELNPAGTRADRREARETKRCCVRSRQRILFRAPKASAGPVGPTGCSGARNPDASALLPNDPLVSPGGAVCRVAMGKNLTRWSFCFRRPRPTLGG
jgi:hypothetical protein